MMETPSISNYASASNSYTGAQAMGLGALVAQNNMSGLGAQLSQHALASIMNNARLGALAPAPMAETIRAQRLQQQRTQQVNQEDAPMTTTRLVQIFIADPDENVPIEQRLLYSGEQKLTDATDQELFFEIDIRGVLEAHNAKRVKLIDKNVKERTEYLEPVRVRDLRMVVVDVAKF